MSKNIQQLIQASKKIDDEQKHKHTYNSGHSLVVTHPTTNPPTISSNHLVPASLVIIFQAFELSSGSVEAVLWQC